MRTLGVSSHLISSDLRRSQEELASHENEFDAVEDVQTTLGNVLACRQHVTPNLSCPMVAALPRAGCSVEAESSDRLQC